MVIYIPQNLDPYNTHMKNLAEAYTSRGIEVITGFKNFISEQIIPDIIHFHFLEGLLKYIKYDADAFFKHLDFFKGKGVSLLYTIHDFKPHAEISKLDYHALFRKFITYVNLFIHHGESSVGIFTKTFPEISSEKHIICHHGDYLNDMKTFNESKERARKILKLPENKKIILIFGQLQFKNTSFANKVLNEVRKKYNNAILLMAGVSPKFRYNRLNKIYYKFNNKVLNIFRFKRILIHKRFSQFETYLLFTASDVIFLPHNSGLTTGIIPMAATLGKPFVYPDIGVFKEQAKYCLAEKYECENISGAYNAIDNILTSGKTTFDNSKWLENNNWGKHVEQILSIYPPLKFKNV